MALAKVSREKLRRTEGYHTGHIKIPPRKLGKCAPQYWPYSHRNSPNQALESINHTLRSTKISLVRTCIQVPSNTSAHRKLKESPVITLISTNIPPPPVLCTALPEISMVTMILTPHSNDPRKNIAKAINKAGLRPKMSLTLPHEGVDAALARR